MRVEANRVRSIEGGEGYKGRRVRGWKSIIRAEVQKG